MWRKLVQWHRNWEERSIALVAQPELVEQVLASDTRGYYRWLAKGLARQSALERQDMLRVMQGNRGWRSYAWLAALVAVFCVLGAVLHLVYPAFGWGRALALANALGLALVFIGYIAWTSPGKVTIDRYVTRFPLYVLYTTAVVCVISMWRHGMPLASVIAGLPALLLEMAGYSLLLAVPMLAIAAYRNRQLAAQAARLRDDAERERLARELAESQLRLLRAQIEPHFLFNTLGAVQQLAVHAAPRAAALTADLIDFLRASLGEMRSDRVQLDAEFGLVESYLKVMQARLGERLRYRLALPPELAALRVPGMVLLTLVENAIKHGIEPALRGGGIDVSAALEGGTLVLRVADSGAGIAATPGAGTGLDNLRQRLRLAFGETAALTLAEGDPGAVAQIRMPVQAL
jgi:signal transduction histidine kinase